MSTYDDARDALSDLIDFASNLRGALELLRKAELAEQAAGCYGRSNTDYTPPSGKPAPPPIPGQEPEDLAVVTNDPTHAAATQRDARVAALQSAARRVYTETGRARHALLNGVDAVQAALKPPAPPKDAIDASTPEDGLCVNCLKAGAHSPRAAGKATMCTWCRDFKTDHVNDKGKHEYPTAQLVDRHTRTGKITAMDLRAAGFRRLAETEKGAA